ncbi:MAG: hypothetical protein KatS3mg091_662 [Patescibacteria group bacterium]|nr:MAG: hypothetical protein KatS3mg090_0009 [Patescibacteria group bacterium]GIW63860.1 MAG: hypothetical protein KatS3mg091_662 [Patescibacteria group bacterium]GIW65017.1 MAG: hypothetical protein KatS3mg092_0950 [Patescibacteria group bacterium]
MNKIYKTGFENCLKAFTIISIFLYRLFSIRILGTHIYTNQIAYILTIVPFIFIVPKLKSELYKKRRFFLLLSFFLISITLSLSKSLDIISSMKIWKNFVIGFLLFNNLVVYFSKKDISLILTALLSASFVNLILQIGFFISPQTYLKYLEIILHPSGIDYLIYSLNRGRLFGNTFEEVFIPIILYFFVSSRNKNFRFFLFCFFLLIIFLTNIANWRTKLIVFFVVSIKWIIFYKFIYQKRATSSISKKIIIPLLLIFLIFYFSNFFAIKVFNKSALFRIIFPENTDYRNINIRIEMWKKAIEIGNSNLLLGVGLGNYYYYFDSSLKNYSQFYLLKKDEYTLTNPHNIFFSLFSESGVLGVISFMLLVIYFFSFDFKYIKNNRKNLLFFSLILSFWGLFMVSLFHPIYDLTYLSLFWILRGLIIVETKSS